MMIAPDVKVDPVMQQFFAAAKNGPNSALKFIEDRITPEEKAVFENFQQRQEAIPHAYAKPLPGPAAGAFINGPVSVCGHTVYEVMPIHALCLQAIDSPILRLAANAETGEKASQEFEPKEERELCFVFTVDPETLENTPKQNRKAFIVDGSKAFAKSNAATINGICTAIIEQYRRHMSTTLRIQKELEGQVDASFFQEQKSQSVKPVASAGS